MEELYGDLRGAISMGLILAVYDGGAVQTVDVQTHDGKTHAGVEVIWPFGFSSVPVPAGAICMVLAVGADPANLRALPLGNQGARFGNMVPGETVMYGGDGSRVAIRNGGTVDVQGAASVHITAPVGVITCTGGLTIAANVLVQGTLTATGDISDQNGAHGTVGHIRDVFDIHRHGGVQTGDGTTDIPTALL